MAKKNKKIHIKKSNIILLSFLGFIFISPIIIILDLKANIKSGKVVADKVITKERKKLEAFQYISIDNKSANVTLKQTDSTSYYFMDYGEDIAHVVKNDTLFITSGDNRYNTCNLFAHNVKGIIVNDATLNIADSFTYNIAIKAINGSNINMGLEDNDTLTTSISNTTIMADKSTITILPKTSVANTTIKLTGASTFIIKPDINFNNTSIALSDSVDVQAPYEQLKKLNLFN